MPRHDLIVIGAGPGGYVAAIRAAQLGMNVACVEKEPALGGTCLRVGCIPSKALLESSEHYHFAAHRLAEHGVKAANVELDLKAMLARKEKVVGELTRGVGSLFKKNNITRYAGVASFSAPGKLNVTSPEETIELEAPHIIIATGSVSANLPGVELNGDTIGTSTEALSYAQVPKRLVVIGAGYIGLELGIVWLRLGAQVTVLEYLDRILPGMDAEIAREAQKLFKRQGLDFQLGSRVTGARVAGDHCVVEKQSASDPGKTESIECDRVLLAVGRSPNTAGLGLDKAGVSLDAKGRVEVDDHFRTSAPGVHAIGDVIRGPMLAHKAEEEGVACVEFIATGAGHVNYDAIPGIVYTAPEVATVGKSEEELQAAGTPYRKGIFHFRGNARAKAIASVDGFVKVLAHQQTDRVLGVHIVGPHAGDLIAEAVAAIDFGASAEDIARVCHAHPTLSEAVKEASLAVDGRAIHA